MKSFVSASARDLISPCLPSPSLVPEHAQGKSSFAPCTLLTLLTLLCPDIVSRCLPPSAFPPCGSIFHAPPPPLQVGDRALASLSTTHTALTHLNILDCPAPETPAGMSSLSQLPSLVSLSARDIRGDLDSKDLGLCALTSLELIDEYGTMDDSAVLQVSSLAGLQALCLSVGFPAEISIQGLEPLSKLKSLASLSLDIVNLCDFHLQQLGGLVGLTRLEVGYLTEEGVGLEALWPLGQRLEALKLEASERFCRADALRHLTALTDLSLRDCSGITDEGLGRGLAPLGRLTRLDISWCRRLTTEGLLATLMPLRRLSRLDTDGLRSASSTVRVMLGIPER